MIVLYEEKQKIIRSGLGFPKILYIRKRLGRGMESGGDAIF